MKTITAEEYFAGNYPSGTTLLDVRSPGEYTAGRLPGAQSLPLFSDAERAEVGTLYKQTSPDAALLKGLEIAGSKMRWLVERARELAPDNKAVVHCWRGGQRSGSVAWLLERAGMDVTQLTGGYKGARTFIRHYLQHSDHNFQVLSGPTGSGKTQVLLAMAELGAHVIDLEGIANHKGSSFGAIGEAPQPSSEQFENILFSELRSIPPGSTVYLEDESRMIGHVYMPDEFYGRLAAAPVTMLEQPKEWRVNRLVGIYGDADPDLLAGAFTRIRKKLGGQHLNSALEAIEAGDLATAASIALVYYDKAYHHYGERRKANVVRTIVAESADPLAVAQQLLMT
ncbi:tRNA 2-selenouridine(34) synthase MnmH [Lewinella sp. 4G2]|uniref:tRNA 2-selenouridine(34) synthase MnmH n=1 Tax=Lewinella sp. 4G2 TaxID=1803372 RepID=UPI0007B4933B|nr:tRNA 2-selenouridine(34) synthase MnmH [Lewinella sp. 4G2]OAV44953.1 tRNA 2-selenouridine(34) synthase MnmH [Lewinella sp. 4G2]